MLSDLDEHDTARRLMKAARMGDPARVRELAPFCDCADQLDINGHSALAWMCLYKMSDAVAFTVLNITPDFIFTAKCDALAYTCLNMSEDFTCTLIRRIILAKSCDRAIQFDFELTIGVKSEWKTALAIVIDRKFRVAAVLLVKSGASTNRLSAAQLAYLYEQYFLAAVRDGQVCKPFLAV